MTSLATTTSRSRRPFYGWWIVVGAVIAQFASMGASGQIGGVFLRPMTDELGWAAWQYTLGGSAAFVFGGVAGFVVGPLVDRHGPRPLMLVGTFCYAAALFGMSRQQELWQFILLSMLAGGAGVSLVGPLVVNITLSKWFVARRGWAIALGSIGISLSGLITPVTMTQVVDSIGWRDAYVVLSVVIVVLLLPVALVMRRTPEDYGLLPDGHRAGDGTLEEQHARSDVAARDAVNSYTRAEAVRTSGLWALTVGFGLNLTAMSAILVHGIPFMTDAGFTRTEASFGFAVNGFANLCSKFVWGWALGRFHPRYLSAGAFASSAAGVGLMVVAAATEALPVMFLGFFAWGFGFGGTIPLGEFLWAKYYGRRHIGAVRSVGVPFTIIFGSAGPILVGIYFDAIGGYEGAFLALVLVYVIGGTTILTSREPPLKVAADEALTVTET